MSLKEKFKELNDSIQYLIDYRKDEIGYYDEADTLIAGLEDLQYELKIFME